MKLFLAAIVLTFASINAMAGMAEGGDGLNQGPYGSTAYTHKCSVNNGQVTLYISMSPFIVDATIWDSHANKITNRSLKSPQFVAEKNGTQIYQLAQMEPAVYLSIGSALHVMDDRMNAIAACQPYQR